MGRAGVGKTAHCLNAITASLRESPLIGPRMILVVPEQASLQMERALLDRLAGRAIHRAEVLSFRRLAFRILDACGDGGRSALTPTARAMALRLLIARHASEMHYYKRAHRFTGFIEKLGRSISEFIQESVHPDDLCPPAGNEDEPIRALKLHDLRLLYKAYLELLGDSRMDPSGYLDVARARLPHCHWLTGACIYVDGFAGFSRQEQLMLVALADSADHMDLTAMLDPISSDCNLFAKTQRMVSDLGDLFRSHDITVDAPLTITDPPRRFDKCQALAHMEKHLFTPSPPERAPAVGIRIIQAVDRRTEVEFAVSRILRHVRRAENPLQYRDIAVILRDMEPYHTLLSAALQARNIPFFMDRRRPTNHHPLVMLIRAMLEFACGDYAIEPIRTLLKTGLIGLADADELENYLLATGVSGRDRWIAGDWPVPPRDRAGDTSDAALAAMKRVNASREHFLRQLDPWITSIERNQPATAATWADRLRATMRHLDVQEQVERLASGAEHDGDLDQAEGHRQVLGDVEQFLEDLETAMGDEPIDITALASVVDAAFAQLTLGLAPPMLDQVLVGSIERSRHPDIKLAFVLGCNEGVFPAIPVEESILNDDDRAWLDKRGVRLGTPRPQRITEESALFYVAVTRPSESLIVTWADADSNGKALHPSPYIASLRAACPGVEVETVDDPFSERTDWAIQTPRDLAAHLGSEFRHRPDSPDDDPVVRQRWNDLYESVRTDEELTETLTTAVRALDYTNSAGLSRAAAAAAVSDPYYASVSQLETYAACAFQHFAKYRLKLRERQLSALAANDVGTIHHAILEHFIGRLARDGRSLADLDAAAVRQQLDVSCRFVAETLPLLGELSHARDRYVQSRGQRELARVLNTQKHIAKAGAFRPKAVEAKFGFADGEGMPALEITTPAKRQVFLRGIIDRVDLAEVSDELLGIVVDYKRSRNRRLDLASAYHGLSLQLLGYLLVLSQRGETLAGRPIKPVGAFYVNLLNQYQSVEHPDDAGDSATEKSPHKPRGILDFARSAALDRETTSGRSPSYAIYRNKSGAPGYIDTTDVAEPRAFDALLQHTARRMGELADRLLDGEIAIQPCRLKSFSPCSWCELKGFCRFEPGDTPTRVFEPMARSEVFRRLIGAATETPDG